MKRLFALLLCLCMVFVFASCKEGDSGESLKQNGDETTTTQGETTLTTEGETEESASQDATLGTETEGTVAGEDTTPSESTSSGNTSSGNTSSGNTSSGNTSSGNTSSGNTSSGNTSSGNTSSGNTSSGNTSSENTPSVPITKIVADPHTWYQKFKSLPIANADMTTAELRQLVVDYFRLQLSFTWTPNKDLNFIIVNKNRPVSLPAGIAYSGLCYAAGQGVLHGQGNIYKILNYYDTQTGVLDVEAMGDHYLEIIGSNCSYGPGWAWNRVSNSIKLYTMAHYTPSNGALLVGPYTYDESQIAIHEKNSTPKIIQQNGAEVMYQSYAAMLPGDGLYSSSAYHVQMCSIAPVVVKNPDGTINPDKSYLHLCEQETDGTSGWLDPIMQSNGVPMRTLGTLDVKVTFKQMLDKGYIPFTIPELVGKETVEPGKAWIGSSSTAFENGMDISLSDISKRILRGNYVISNVHLEVKDASGKIVFSDDPYVYTRNRSYNVEMSKVLDVGKLSQYANGTNTIHIYAQLTNGELIEAFHTILK